MKKFKELYQSFSDKLNSVSSWKYFMYCYIFLFTFTMTIFYFGFHHISLLAGDVKFTEMLVLKLSLSVSALLSFMFSFLMLDTRNIMLKNVKFWLKAKEVALLLTVVKTKLDVEAVYPAYNELINLSSGGSHITETTRLKTIIEVKLELLP